MKENMTQEILTEEWPEFRHAIKNRWPEIPDVELDRFAGQSDMLVGVLQEHFWITKNDAEEQLSDFLDEFHQQHRRGPRFRIA